MPQVSRDRCIAATAQLGTTILVKGGSSRATIFSRPRGSEPCIVKQDFCAAIRRVLYRGKTATGRGGQDPRLANRGLNHRSYNVRSWSVSPGSPGGSTSFLL